MGTSKAVIREIKSTEYPLLREFLYQAIYLPEGMTPPPRSVVDCPELWVYIENFGTRPGDCCLVTEEKGRVVGAVWSRIMDDYGHIDDATPSLAISLLPEYRGQGMGTELMRTLFSLLQNKGFAQVSLSVQTGNPAFRLYERLGFQIVAEKETEYLMVRTLSGLNGGSLKKV